MVVFIFKGNSLNRAERLVAGTVFLTLLIDLLAGYSSSIVLNNSGIYNLLLPVLYVLVAFIYLIHLDSRQARRLIIVGCLIFLLLHLVNLQRFQSWAVFATFTLMPAQAGLGLLSFLYMRQVVNHINEYPFRDFLFWFSGANLVNYVCTIPIQATLSWLPYKYETVADWLWSVNTWLGYYIYYSILITGLLWTRRFQTSSSL